MKNPLLSFTLAALGSLLFLTAPTARGADTFAATGSLAGARREHTSTLLPTGKVLVAGGKYDAVSLVTAHLYHPAAGTWAATGALGTARFGHTATLLPGGKVLVVGGWNGFYVATAELYDPAGNGGAGSWTPTASPAVARIDHTATLLANGKVLVTGGQGSVSNPGGEIFDPAGNGGAGTWTATGPFVVARYHHSATLLASGKVLVAGGFGSGGYLASAELFDPAANTWTATGSLATGGRDFHTATRLPDGKVLIAGGLGGPGVLATAELYDPVAATWSATGSLGTARFHHTATLLTSGRVLVAGGTSTGGIDGVSSAEIYDPASAGTWHSTGLLGGARQDHTATLLHSGQVLVAGGFNGGLSLTTAELYTPAIDVPWTATGPLGTARQEHTATLLHSGLILVAGGGDTGQLASAELYDPAAGTWAATGSLATGRARHTATMLLSGKVLVVGGSDGVTTLASAELYDPATGTWSGTGALATARTQHTATVLADGKVLVAGGFGTSGSLASAELYDPATGTWSPGGSFPTARFGHTATLLAGAGKVLIAGGLDSTFEPSPSAVLYNPATNAWTATASLATGRYRHSATLLPSGRVLVVGGNGSSALLASAQLFDPTGNAGAGTWSTTGSLATGARANHSAALLPSGKVLIAGGNGAGGVLGSAELYDPAGSGTWSATGSLATARRSHTATLLPGGRVLVAAGEPSGGGFLASAEFYDSAVGGWSPTGSMTYMHFDHTATLLPGGKVLVAGGGNVGGTIVAERYDPAGNGGAGSWTATGFLITGRGEHTATLLPSGLVLVAGGRQAPGVSLASAELYAPATGLWSATGSLTTGRESPTATLLPNGKVLIVGGYGNFGPLASAEIYDPATGLWSTIGPLAAPRFAHTATLLPNGKVLVAGGSNIGYLASAELYDPATGLWSATGSLTTGRESHTATLLPNGKVLVAAGSVSINRLATAELYDPATGVWSPTGSLATARSAHTATLLPSGKVLVAGGQGAGGILNSFASAELYDPAGNGGAGSWSPTGSLAAGRSYHTATLLPSGTVLVAGGQGGGGDASAEIYDAGLGLGFDPAWQPGITSATFDATGQLVLAGTLFRGISSASGGNGSQDSPTSHPLVQLRRLDEAQAAFLLSDPATPISAGDFTSRPLADLRPGSVQVTVFVNGIPSPAVIVAIPEPDILVQQQPALFSVADGDTADFDTTVNGAPVSLTFTIRNTGALNLTGLTITRDGADAADYAVTASPTAPVAPNGTTTFTVRFLPTGGLTGLRNAAIHIASNVTGTKNPYDINLVGQALSFTQDSDLDGLNDAAEFLLSPLGFDWQNGSQAQKDLVTNLSNNAYAAGLYTPAQVQTLNVGVPLIQKDVVTGRFKLTIGVQKTPDLATVPFAAFPFSTPGATTVINGAGKLEFEFTVPDNAAFFRLQAQ